jgi:hypothetical protein
MVVNHNTTSTHNDTSLTEYEELCVKAAKNNMTYDSDHFHTQYEKDCHRLEKDPNYFAPWIEAAIEAKEQKLTDKSSDYYRIRSLAQLSVFNDAMDTAYCRRNYADIPNKPLKPLEPLELFEHEGGGNGNNAGNHMNGREIRLDPEVRVRLERVNIRIRNEICIVCHQATNEFIEHGCNSDCAYYCHDECAARWIAARFDNPRPYCMVCGVDHTLNQIPRIMTDNGFVNAVRLMVQGNFLDLNNLGPQFLEYMDYRGIEFQQLDLGDPQDPNDVGN